MGVPVTAVEDPFTGYPSILGRTSKNATSKVFGGILKSKRKHQRSKRNCQLRNSSIGLGYWTSIPLKLPWLLERQEEIIEKIDIGGIALIRTAAKNFKDVVCVAQQESYNP